MIVDVLGHVVEIRAASPVEDELQRLLVDLRTPAEATHLLTVEDDDDGLRLVEDGRIVRAPIRPDLIAPTVLWRLNGIAANSTTHVAVHAGAVAADGGAVLLPGTSGAGKSTLTRACLLDGMGYLSDELAAVGLSDGLLAPYPRPISVGRDLLVASTLVDRPASAAVPPAAIVFAGYVPGAITETTELDPEWTLLGLLAHATNLGSLGPQALAVLVALAEACPGLQIEHSDARAVVARLRECADRRRAPVVPARPIRPVTDTTTTFSIGKGLAVFDHRSERVHVLNGATAQVWCRHAGERLDDGFVDAASHIDPAMEERTRCRLRELELLD